jgi:hypothetical protein
VEFLLYAFIVLWATLKRVALFLIIKATLFAIWAIALFVGLLLLRLILPLLGLALSFPALG